MKNDVYMTGDQIPDKCVMCGRTQDLRMGWCFDCAEAQSIIGNGIDMDDRGNGGIELPVKEANQRLRLLFEKGWQPPIDTNE